VSLASFSNPTQIQVWRTRLLVHLCSACSSRSSLRPDRSIDIAKAVRVNEQFQVTRQFWAYAAENGMVSDVRGFLNPVPHVSFVHGAERVDYLRRRRQALADNPLFARNELVEGADEFARRLPYMATGRNFSEPVALNWAVEGTDVDFGALARQLIGYGVRNGTIAWFGHEVRNLSRRPDGGWTVTLRNRRTAESQKLDTAFIFVGAGGAAPGRQRLSGRGRTAAGRVRPAGAPRPCLVSSLDR